MGKRILIGSHRHTRTRSAARRHFQQRLGGFTRQMREDVEQARLGHTSHVVEPLGRHAIPEQLIVVEIRVGRGLQPRRSRA